MGHVHADVELQGTKGSRSVKALIDTGATCTAVSPQLAEELGAVKTPWTERVTLADGQTAEARVAMLRVRLLDRAFTARVLLLAAPEPLIGVDTLETLGLKVDPTTGQLEQTRTFVARA